MMKNQDFRTLIKVKIKRVRSLLHLFENEKKINKNYKFFPKNWEAPLWPDNVDYYMIFVRPQKFKIIISSVYFSMSHYILH